MRTEILTKITFPEGKVLHGEEKDVSPASRIADRLGLPSMEEHTLLERRPLPVDECVVLAVHQGRVLAIQGAAGVLLLRVTCLKENISECVKCTQRSARSGLNTRERKADT